MVLLAPVGLITVKIKQVLHFCNHRSNPVLQGLQRGLVAMMMMMMAMGIIEMV